MKRTLKIIFETIIILILIAGCAYVLMRVTNKTVKENAELKERVGLDSKEIEALCEKYGTKIEFFPGDYNKTKIVKNLTVYQGVDYSLVYHPQYYYTNYEPAREACGTDEVKLIKHFLSEGMSLGVKGNEKFDVASYYNSSKDLRVLFGPDFSQYYMHYIKEGHNDPNRKIRGVEKIEDPITVYNDFDYAKVYDFNYYLANNPELTGYITLPGPGGCLDDALLLAHFVEAGIDELRQGSENFDFVSYFLSNPDLRDLYGLNYLAYVVHYVNNGPQDNRPAVGRHNIAEFEQVRYDMLPTIEKETAKMLDYVGNSIGGAYYWCVGIPYVSLPLNWSAEGYAMYAFGNWCGNCFAKAAAFYYMARALGYDARLVSGHIQLEGGGLSTHGWVEIDGLVYDPDFETEKGMNGFGISYGQPGTWQYTQYWYMA